MESGTKLRILYLYQHLIRNTDPDHPMSTAELTRTLADQYGIKVSRNTISDDLAMLLDCDLQIEVIRSTQNKYYYDGQVFEEPEMKLLIDAVLASKFITERKSEQLINKLLTLVPVMDALKLRRHVFVSGRVKSDNERGYYIVDAVNDAIDSGNKISFLYTEFDINKKRVYANGGNPYTVSPYMLIWDGDYYYLRGFCDERNAMRNFRLDRIEKQPEILHEAAVPKPEKFSIANYSRSVFQMFDTDQPEGVTLLCDKAVMKSVIDVFGQDVDTVPVDDDYFVAKVKVCTSPTFFGWVFSFAGQIKITGPEEIVKQYQEMASV